MKETIPYELIGDVQLAIVRLDADCRFRNLAQAERDRLFVELIVKEPDNALENYTKMNGATHENYWHGAPINNIT